MYTSAVNFLHQRPLSQSAVFPVLCRGCSRGCRHAVSAAVSSVSDQGTFRKQSCINASEEQEMKQRSHWNLQIPSWWRGRFGGTEMRIGLLSWRGLLFHISAATSAGGAAWRSVGPAGSLRGKGPICCMRLFLTRFSTGCHLFGDTLGRRDYGEEGMCVCVSVCMHRHVGVSTLWVHCKHTSSMLR